VSIVSSSDSRCGIVLVEDALPASILERRRRLSEVRMVNVTHSDVFVKLC